MPLLNFIQLGLLSSVSPLLQSLLPKCSVIIINNDNNSYNDDDDDDDGDDNSNNNYLFILAPFNIDLA